MSVIKMREEKEWKSKYRSKTSLDINDHSSKAFGLKLSDHLLNQLFGYTIAPVIKKYSNEILIPIQNIEINKVYINGVKEYFNDKAKGFYYFVRWFAEAKKQPEKLLENDFLPKKFGVDVCLFNLKYKTNSAMQSNRFLLRKNEETFKDRICKIILLQKEIRRFLAQKRFRQIFNEELRRKITNTLKVIQSKWRQYHFTKKFKTRAIVKRMLIDRQASASLIISFFKMQKLKTEICKQILLCKIVVNRLVASIRIQAFFRSFKMRKMILSFLINENQFYVLYYPFWAKDVKIIVYINKSERKEEMRMYNFTYCPFRDLFFLYIDPSDFKPGKYRCQFIVDNSFTCDGRYPHIEFSDGKYYNIVDFNTKSRKYSSYLINYQNSQTNTNTKIISNEEKEEEKCHKESISGVSYDGSYTMEAYNNYDINYDKELKRNLQSDTSVSYLETLKEGCKDEIGQEFEN
jgi:hypothetical protein